MNTTRRQWIRTAARLAGAALFVAPLRAFAAPLIFIQPQGGSFSPPHTLTVGAWGSSLVYRWQTDFGSHGNGTFVDLADHPESYEGTNTAALKIIGSTLSFWKFRCVVSNSTGSTTSSAVSVKVMVSP